MNNIPANKTKKLTDHFFRNEYGKLVAVITKYIGVGNVHTAEDIVQETLLKAVDYWEQNGIPENPKAWLYTTAKNMTLNILKRNKAFSNIKEEIQQEKSSVELDFSDDIIADEQLKMMFACCYSGISEDIQIALILKILCGFSIEEIANAFFSNKETINKRLVRGRKQLKNIDLFLLNSNELHNRLEIIQKTIYLLFNEGYSPTQKNELLRFDLCLEAIRLNTILIENSKLKTKSDSYALSALMYFNTSRFNARMNSIGEVIEMEHQDRRKWDVELISKGVESLNLATQENRVSKYLILATISAYHCIAKTFKDTNWKEILSLYNDLLSIENSSVVYLNRAVALSMVDGVRVAIKDLTDLAKKSDIHLHSYYHIILADFYYKNDERTNAVKSYQKAISMTNNSRDLKLLEKKLNAVVPI